MHKAKNSGRIAGPQPDIFKLRKLGVAFSNACMRVAIPDRRSAMRLAPPDRLRVERLLEQFTFGKASTASIRGRLVWG